MCGRFTLTQPELLAEHFGVHIDPVPPPRYNIAPSQPVGVILKRGDHPPEYRLQQWGLIPAWARDAAIGNRLINARVETAHEKPSFRDAFKRRRCLIPVDGFYEWKKAKQGKQGKQPYYFQLPQHQLFALGGLWETWQDIETFTILTTAASADIQSIHHRMPVILAPENYAQWLDPNQTDNAHLLQLIHAHAPATIQRYAVSTKVSNARVDQPDCIVAINGLL